MVDIEKLSSNNWRERKQAIESLAQSDDVALAQYLLDVIRNHYHDLDALNGALQLLNFLKTPVTPGLLLLLKDTNPDVRIYATLALSELQDPQSIPDLIKALSDQDSNVRFNAIEAVGKLHVREAVDRLVEIIKDRDFYLSFPAIRAIGEIGDPGPLPEIEKLLEDNILAGAAVEALGNLGDLSTVPLISRWLDSPSGNSESAIFALANLAAKISLRSQDTSPYTIEEIGPSIAKMLSTTSRSKMISAIPSELDEECYVGDVMLLPRLAQILGWILASQLIAENSPEAITIRSCLVRLLEHPSSRNQAAQILEQSGRVALPELLIGLMSDRPIIERECARLLGKLHDPASLSSLIGALDSGDEDTAVYILEAIGDIGSKYPDISSHEIESLIAHLSHGSPRIRRMIVHALISMDRPEIIKRMNVLFRSSNEAVRESAILVLSQKPDAQAKEVILGAIDDPSIIVRKAVIEALPSIPDSRALSLLDRMCQDKDASIRAATCHALAKCLPEFALPRLYTALKDSDPVTRFHACFSLGQIANPDSLQHLLSLIDDPMPSVRVAVAEALSQIGGEVARQAIQKLLSDPRIDVHKAVESALVSAKARSAKNT
ncbi:MAG: HEAT repeat domain-containing protein [Omnitrophica WOR_2 bacterium]